MTLSAPDWLRRVYASLRRRGAETTITTIVTTTVPAEPADAAPPPPPPVAHDTLEIAERRIAGLDWHIAAIEAARAVDARQ